MKPFNRFIEHFRRETTRGYRPDPEEGPEGDDSYPDDWDDRRRQVYQRDNYECQNCGKLGGKSGDAELHAHHIVPLSNNGTNNLSNLVTLCKECHLDGVNQEEVGEQGSETLEEDDDLSSSSGDQSTVPVEEWPGTTPQSQLPSNWDEIRREIYELDDYECQVCGAKGGTDGTSELHAHHVHPVEHGGHHTTGNLITLCRDCHKKVHFDEIELFRNRTF